MKTQSGRSMIEIIGVLAVMGVLSIAVLYLYPYLVAHHKSNETWNDVLVQATVVQTSHTDDTFAAIKIVDGEELPSLITSEEFKTSAVGYPMHVYKTNDVQFIVQVDKVDYDVCEIMLKKHSLVPDAIEVGNSKFEPIQENYGICETSSTKTTSGTKTTMYFYFSFCNGDINADCDADCGGNFDCFCGRCWCPIVGADPQTCQCPKNYEIIKGECVCPTGDLTTEDVCCPKGEHAEGDICCPDGQYNSKGICCPSDLLNGSHLWIAQEFWNDDGEGELKCVCQRACDNNDLIPNADCTACVCPKDKPYFYNEQCNVCPKDQTYAKATKTCCPNARYNRTNGVCCSEGWHADNGICCQDGQHNSEGICCPDGQHNSEGICCPEDQYYSNGGCCPKDQTYVTASKTCCPNARYNRTNGVCCREGWHADNGICCQDGQYNSDGICCQDGKYNSEGVCCPEDQYYSNGVCCPNGQVVDEKGNFCNSSRLNTKTNICCPSPYILFDKTKEKCVCPNGGNEVGYARENDRSQGKGWASVKSCCDPDTEHSSNGYCCPKGKEYYRDIRDCCFSSKWSSKEKKCCADDEEVSNGYCCPKGKIYKSKSYSGACCLPEEKFYNEGNFRGCCLPSKWASSQRKCCDENEVASNGYCCLKGTEYYKDINFSSDNYYVKELFRFYSDQIPYTHCCPPKKYTKYKNRSYCCSSSQTISNNHCCPIGESWADKTEECCPNERYGVNKNGVGVCCAKGKVFAENSNSCCPVAHYVAETKSCCPSVSDRCYKIKDGTCCRVNSKACRNVATGFQNWCK